MLRADVKISRDRRKLRIIRTEDLIDQELDLYRSRMHLRESLTEKEIPGLKDEIEALKREIEEEKQKEAVELSELADDIKNKKPKHTWYVKEFVLKNDDKPIEIDLSKVVEDSVPISVAKEEIQIAYERGQEDGQLMAMSTYKSELEKYQEWIRQIDSVTDTFKKDYLLKVDQFEQSLIELSVMIAEQILNTEIDQDKSVVVSQVRKAIRSIHKERIFQININPEVYGVLEEVKSSLLEDERLSKEIVLYPDVTVPIGGCILETSAGLIDARIASQLRQIRDSLESEEAVILDEEEEARMHEDKMESMRKDHTESAEEILTKEEIPEDFSYDDIPPEYRDMIDPEIFGEEDIDQDGNIIQGNDDEESSDEIEDEIDYVKIQEEEERLKEEKRLNEEINSLDEEEEEKNDEDENNDPPSFDLDDRDFDF